MCGICGAIGFDEGGDRTRRMSDRIIHRGPDSQGSLHRPPIHMASRRLKIIDIATGDQPIFNEDKTLAIVFNGEIYNFQKLCDELILYGHRFATRSDTETIIHAYEQWGADCTKHLRGMFAFAIWDGRPDQPNGHSLFLARDRFGIKPLYIWHDDSRLLFASEVRALLASGAIQRNLSPAGLFSFLAFGSVQEPLSLINNVESLAPASWMQVSLIDEKLCIKVDAYWQPPNSSNQPVNIQNVHQSLKDAVSSHLVSEASLGIFLSGGLDSGTIASFAAEVSGRNEVQGITFDFNNGFQSEVDLAKLTAEKCGVSLSISTLQEDELLSDLPQIFSDMDQPSLDGVNSWYISREARRAGWKVALSGVGGDELFAGYPSFKYVGIMNRLPTSLSWVKPFSEWKIPFPGGPDAARKFFSYLAGDSPFGHSYYAMRGLFTFSQIRDLLNGRAAMATDSSAFSVWAKTVARHVQLVRKYDNIAQISWMEISQYMCSTLLRDLDAMSMAHSLEVRVPFVDHILIETILPIAASYKHNGRQPKPLLLQAMAKDLPVEVMRSGKRTFTFPFQVWLRQKLSHQVKEGLENCMEMPEWFDAKKVQEVWNDFELGRTSWARPWTLFVLGEWVGTHL